MECVNIFSFSIPYNVCTFVHTYVLANVLHTYMRTWLSVPLFCSLTLCDVVQAW